MKKMLSIGLVMMLCAGAFGCTNMSRTQQGVASGAALGALGGAGIATISGGSAGWGALAGALPARWPAVSSAIRRKAIATITVRAFARSGRNEI